MADASADATLAPTGELTDLTGSTLGRRYEVGALLGEGGMGAVFCGRHLGLSRDVAIKVLRPEFTQHRQIAARFEREAKVVSRLSHPAIVEVFDFGVDPTSAIGRPIMFIVMELLAGRELKDYLGAPMEPDLALARTEQILEGIAHAHERKVVHRDLKPENVFVTKDPSGREQLKLVDFGIAKLREAGGPALTQMGMVFGTPAYMSPEQAMGSMTDERTDLYAVGVILYEMLAGHTPFEAEDIGVLLRKQIQEEPPPIAGLAPGVQSLLDGLLKKSAAERTATAEDAIAAVQDARASLSMAAAGGHTLLATGEMAAALSGSGPVTAVRAPSVETPSPTPRAIGWPTPQRRWAVPAVAAVACSLLLTLILYAASDDDEVDADAAPAVAVGAAPAADGPGRAPELDLAQVDALLTGEKWDVAARKLESMLQAYPLDGRVHWRHARLLRGTGVKPEERGRALAQAIALEPALLHDDELGDELAKELSAKHVAPELVTALIQTDADPGFLAQLAVRTKNAVPYEVRHEILQALAGEGARVDRAFHRCLDLWQAADAADPCAAYRAALDEMARTPDDSHLGSLAYATPPKGCAGLAARQREVHDGHRSEFPEAKLSVPPDYEDAKPKKKKRRRGGWRSWFR